MLKNLNHPNFHITEMENKDSHIYQTVSPGFIQELPHFVQEKSNDHYNYSLPFQHTASRPHSYKMAQTASMEAREAAETSREPFTD